MILSIHDFFFYFFSVFQDLPISQDHYLKNVANHRSFARQMELRDYFRSPKRGELFHDIGSTKFFDIHKITNSRVFFWIHIYKLQVQSNLAIRNFLVTLKLFLNAKSSLLQTLNQSTI